MAPTRSKAGPQGQTSLNEILKQSSTHAADGIGQVLLERLYRLQDASQAFVAENGCEIGPIHNFQACPNIWNSSERRKAALQFVAVNGNRKKVKVDFDTEDGNVAPLDTICWKDECAKNPRCLNWLGQETWEQSKL